MVKFKTTNINEDTSARILSNTRLNRYLVNHSLNQYDDLVNIVDNTVNGSMVYTFGSGDDYLLVGGVHGNELSSQVALLRLIHNILEDKLDFNASLHIVPFLIPIATSKNERCFNNQDMNRNTFNKGPTNDVLNYACDVGIKALCDCHSTDPSLKPGINSVFCSIKPNRESYMMAKYICENTTSKLLPIMKAGSVIRGALEDESNLRGIPAVTCEVLSRNGYLDEDSVNFSYKQILSFLKYHNIIK